MNCPKCDTRTTVVDSRSDRDTKHYINILGTVHRVRRCPKCEYRFATVEIPRQEYEQLCDGTLIEDRQCSASRG